MWRKRKGQGIGITDRDKVIKGIQECDLNGGLIGNCPYKGILDLLKEQEEDKPKGHWMPHEPDKRGYTDEFTCSRCELVTVSDHYCKMIDFDFCPHCGAYMDNAEGRW